MITTQTFLVSGYVFECSEKMTLNDDTELAVRVLRCSLHIFKIAAIFITDVIFIISCIL